MIKDIIRNITRNVIQGIDGTLNPLDLNPIAWWDASDAATITESGGIVSQWDDKSGSGYDLVQATGASQPAYSSSTISFDGSDDYLWYANSIMYSDTNTVTIFIVADCTNVSTNTFLVAESDTVSVARYSTTRIGFSDATRLSANIINDASTSVTGNTTNTGFLTAKFSVYMVEDDLSNIRSRVDNGADEVTPYTRPAPPFSLDRFAVGARLAASAFNFATVDIKEILIFNTALSSNQKTSVHDYLANKHGVT